MHIAHIIVCVLADNLTFTAQCTAHKPDKCRENLALPNIIQSTTSANCNDKTQKKRAILLSTNMYVHGHASKQYRVKSNV